MSNKLQVLWDHFVHAEPLNTRKTLWLDIFLAELLSQLKEGQDVKDVLSFCSLGTGISAPITCQLLSDVHDLCARRDDGSELSSLRKYLLEDRGWWILVTLHLLGVRGISCAKELVTLLLALYPVAFQANVDTEKPNAYIKFHCNDDAVDTVDIVPHLRKKSPKHGSHGEAQSQRRKKIRKHEQRKPAVLNKQNTEVISSESEIFSDGLDQARSLTLKIRLNPMDFDYFNTIVHSDEETRRESNVQSQKITAASPEDFLDERLQDVFSSKVSSYEMSLLIVQLLQTLRDYDSPSQQTLAVQVLKFSLDTLWSLQFGIDGHFSGLESAGLKAAASRLMLIALERVLQTDDSTTKVIHNGLLPMTLRLLEDACSRPVTVRTSEEGTLLQEFLFAITYGIVTFLYCLLHQRDTTERLKDFLELFQLFTESQEGKLVERTILTIVDLPSVNEIKTVNRAKKIIDMIGALMSCIKKVRQNLFHMSRCQKAKHKNCIFGDSNHHFDILGAVYSQPMMTLMSDKNCCVSSLFMTLISLLKQPESFNVEVVVRLLKVSTAAGTCCCFPPKILLTTVVNFLKTANSQTYAPAIALLERSLYKELGGFQDQSSCGICCERPTNVWDSVELYTELMQLDEPKLCYAVMAHLYKVTIQGCFFLKQELLTKVFFPTFLKAKKSCLDERNSTSKFMVQSCLSVMANLVANCQMYAKFSELGGLKHVLEIITQKVFSRNAYSLLEMNVVMEIWTLVHDNTKAPTETDDLFTLMEDNPTVKALLDCLRSETNCLLDKFDSDVIISAMNKYLVNSIEDFKSSEMITSTPIPSLDLRDSIEPHPRQNTHLDSNIDKTDNSLMLADNFSDNVGDKSHLKEGMVEKQESERSSKMDNRDIHFYDAYVVWRTAAGVVLCTPMFRTFLRKHELLMKAVRLLKILAVHILTDNIIDSSKSAYRLLEALITCCLIIPSCDCDIVEELGVALTNCRVKFGKGLPAIIDALLRVSMLRTSKEQVIPQISQPRLPTMTMDTLSEFMNDDSSAGEYVTADDGYEADIEIQGRASSSIQRKKNNSSIANEPRGHVNAHPALCSLAVNLLIHFSEQDMDNERLNIVTNGLKKVADTCKESPSSCAMLAGSGAISRLLKGFQNVLTDKDPKYQDLQHAIVEVFTLLASQSISSEELSTYLSFFKVQNPPLLVLLQPLYRLVLLANPQPNFILSFPIGEVTEQKSAQNQKPKSERSGKVGTVINNFRKKHVAAGICSPWSVHATCLPVNSELAWSVWLHGCSASMWLRVERGSTNYNRLVVTSPLLNTDYESLADWGVLSDNWSKEVVAGSKTPPLPTSIVHMVSIGFESLVLEMWLDLKSDKLFLRLTRPDDKNNRTISETTIAGVLPSGRWHHLALNVKDTVLNKHSATVDIQIWIDGWREVNARLPFDGMLTRKTGTSCILLGQVGSSESGAWYLGNLMMFRCPIFTKERALYLASLGPNFTNLAECLLNNAKPDYAPLIASGALNGVRESKLEGGKFDINRRKSYGGTYLRHPVETKVTENKIDWESIMDSTSSQLCELQDNLLLNYEAQNPNLLHLYPQAVSNPTIVRSFFPNQPGFRVASAPEHRVSQQPPLTVSPILYVQSQCQQYRGLIPSVNIIGGIPIFLYLFARVVELHSTEEEQALALSVVLQLARRDSELSNQYTSEGGASLILRVLESSRCHAGKLMLKAILDVACDGSLFTKESSHQIPQDCEAVIIDPELIKGALEAWRTWTKYDTFDLLLQALLLLLRDQHSQREFNATQLNRIGTVDTLLTLCKEHFLYEEVGVCLDTTTGNTIVELVRALMGAPPEFAHLVAITDYLVLVHQASETYVTHSKHNIYFLLKPLEEKKLSMKTNSAASVCTSDESLETLENSKLNKALKNAEIQKSRISKRSAHSTTSQDTSGGEDSGIAASDGSNQQTNEKQSVWSDERRACQSLVCEGLLLLLRDALRVLPDSQIASVLKHVIRGDILLVLANNSDTRVRTALIKVIHTYLQRASEEETTKFIKQKYFMHLANQISLYPGSEPLITALEGLVLRGPMMAAVPPLLAMMAKTAFADNNIASSIVSFITDIGTKKINVLKILLEQGLIESLSRALINAAHTGGCNNLYRDIHVLLVAIVSKLLESPGNHHLQAVIDIHLILNHVEISERSQCGSNKSCVYVARDAQVALFDGELDILTAKLTNHSGFKLKSTTSYLATTYLPLGLTTSSEQSDHTSRSSSFASIQNHLHTSNREPGKSELDERFRVVLNRAVDFITTSAEVTSASELQLSKRLFYILLQGLSSPFQRKIFWGSGWSIRSKSTLRKNTARIMLWLLAPHQINSTRVYAVRSLMEEPKTKDILSTLLEVSPQIEQRFSLFLWDLLSKRDKMPSAEARACSEFKEALNTWQLTKNSKNVASESSDESTEFWEEEILILRRELMRERDIWIENNLSAIQRIGNRFDSLVKQLTENAMMITRVVVEEQNRERKSLIDRLKQSKAMEASAMARWRDLVKRLTHEMALWHFPESYPRSWELDPTEGPGRIRIRLQRCHLNIDQRFFLPNQQEKLSSSLLPSPLSFLFSSSARDSTATALIERLHTSEPIRKMSTVKVVTPRADLSGEALIGEIYLYFVPENPENILQSEISGEGLDLVMAGGTAWRLEDIREIRKRRYQLQERALEIFLVTGRTYLLAFDHSKARDEFTDELFSCNMPRRIPGDDLDEALSLWRSGQLTNWEYVMRLNKLAGRSYNDLMQYPVFPFVLSDYVSEKIDLTDAKIYRNFKRPMAVQDKNNEQHYINNYNYMKQAQSEGLNLIALNQEPFHYGSHYSNSGTVLHFLVRLPPFTSMFLCYQDDNFDIPDRTFHALATTWRLTSCDSTTDVKELIPEFFYLPEFLLNTEGFNFGVRQNGNRVGNVELPKWCGGDARIFILAHRAALESDLVRQVLPYWIDLVFGFRQTGSPAVEAINVFHPATYYGFDVERIQDPLERQAWETMVKTYGQTPAQLFKSAHPLPILNFGSSPASNLPTVIDGVDGIKWGSYVGAPGNEPVICWKQKQRAPLNSLVPLVTGDVFGLPKFATLLIDYNREKGNNMLGSATVLAAALVSWNGTDRIARLKSKKEQPPRPLIRSSGHDPISTIVSAPDCGQLWIGYVSGKISVYSYYIGYSGKIEFNGSSNSVLLAHNSLVTSIVLSRAFSIAVSGDRNGNIVIWDLNSLSYVRSITCPNNCPVNLLTVSETLGDIAAVYDCSQNNRNESAGRSESNSAACELRVYTINAHPIGRITMSSKITALCYSNAPEGVSVNVIATGLDNGIIRFWSSWDLRLVREIVSKHTTNSAIIAISWSLDQHHLYAATENSTVIIWEGTKRLSNGTPKFVDLTSL